MRSKKPAYREIEKPIHRDHLVSALAAWLQSVSFINDNETVVNIQFGDLNEELIPIKICLKTPQTIEVIKH